MRRAGSLLAIVGLASLAAGCGGSELEPRTADFVRREMHDPAPVVNAIESSGPPAHFTTTPPAFYRPPPMRESVSLGYIGDEPLGRYDPPPEWTACGDERGACPQCAPRCPLPRQRGYAWR